ncbi:MAG: phospholipase D-like domain-containing protein [Nitrospira sp.]|nr:phospholipase D-like domain-containing protein [Nitrospira sp.]
MSRSPAPSVPSFNLVPRHNCWRVVTAEKLAFLIDAASYFDAFYRAALNAEHSITILSWDIDTRTRLLRNVPDVDEFPTELGPFLRRLLRRKKSLHVHILNWDYSMLYAAERQWSPPIRFGRTVHPQLHFHLNDRHPIGACQHEKLVVIDDTVAFIGGLDLTKHRWDTSEHQEHEPRRLDPDGNTYDPFHDIHTIVAGEVAQALGDLARLRWHRATGEQLAPTPRRPVSEVWPTGVSVDLSNLSVGLARTQPKFEDQPEVREIEHLYLDAIAAARRNIFMESQYLTAHRIGEALHTRLSGPRAPEVVIVTRMRSDGWLERHTMDALRARLIRRLREAAKPRRFRVYWPTASWMSADTCIGVHSKLLIVDDSILTIGSANCSNRSMGLDTECNLVIAGTQSNTVRAGLKRLRHKLLGEHLGRQVSEVQQTERRTRSVIGTITHLNNGARRLHEYSCDQDDEIERFLPSTTLIDPERPVQPDRLWRMLSGLPQQGTVRRHAAIFLSSCVLLGGLGLLWRWLRRQRS